MAHCSAYVSRSYVRQLRCERVAYGLVCLPSTTQSCLGTAMEHLVVPSCAQLRRTGEAGMWRVCQATEASACARLSMAVCAVLRVFRNFHTFHSLAVR